MRKALVILFLSCAGAFAASPEARLHAISAIAESIELADQCPGWEENPILTSVILEVGGIRTDDAYRRDLADFRKSFRSLAQKLGREESCKKVMGDLGPDGMLFKNLIRTKP